MQQPGSQDFSADRPSERATERRSGARSRGRAGDPRPTEPREPGSSSFGAGVAARPDREQLIASRAYGFYLDRGMAHGGDIDDWLEAERQVDRELGAMPR